jgi:hypothetical protein
MLYAALVYKHEAIQILRFSFVAEGLDRKSIVPSGLIHVDSAGLHGGSGAISEIAGLILGFCTFTTQAARP